MARAPIFGRESDTPKAGARGSKLETNFGFATTHGTQINDVAFLFFFSALVDEEKLAAAGNARFHVHQGAVSVDSQGLRILVNASILGIVAVNAHR